MYLDILAVNLTTIENRPSNQELELIMELEEYLESYYLDLFYLLVGSLTTKNSGKINRSIPAIFGLLPQHLNQLHS